MSAFNLLNKVKNEGKDLEQYSINYVDPVSRRIFELSLPEVIDLDPLTIVVRKDHVDVEIPMNAVRKISKRGLVLWDKEKKE